ncbi:hypothetical protein [Nocardioides sp. SYSU D00065]|uniref:hypothetical protein n=1 Tax=Nocardioides sp. SYSU D00065 TaxID=2817378 RepID=UPI001B33F89C|nr:hypothetical protein [Nocardioides sp. SYSU D00065]
MSDASFEGFRCWSAEGVARTVFSDIGALASDADAVFLAAHTPVELDHPKGAEIGSALAGEAQVLDALTSRVGDLERNTLVAVTGGSGSGKSHVVRWVHSHLPDDDPRFRVLYVPRAVQTLRELLRRIIEGLPGVQGDELMSRVDAAISNVRPGELQERLVGEMKIALNWRLEDRPPFDGETQAEAEAREDRNSMLGLKDNETGGRTDGLAELLEIPAFKEALLRPDGRLAQLVRSYFDETSRRDDSDQIFTRDDLPLKARGIRSALAGRRELSDLWQIISREPDDAIELLDEALRNALPITMGLRTDGGETLDSLFRESRKALRSAGQDLILVFEDLAQFGLVDGELYDQFVTQPGDDLAPLRVVFAVTDGAYARMERTVRTRVEHEFRVGGSALSDAASFVGRYLNLVRVGRDETQKLRAGARDRVGSTWMSNACDTREEGQPCRVRDTCHAAFGTVEIEDLGSVGLYPYNSSALRRAVARLGEAPTPRDVLDECISTNLMEADQHIGAGDYPHDRTRQQFDFQVRKAKQALLDGNPSSDPERTYRALVIWGDEAQVAKGIAEAFKLGTSGPAVDVPPPPPPTPPAEEELANPLLPLFQWQVGDDLPEDDVNLYRTILRELTVDRLQLDESLIHVHRGRGKEMLDRLFGVTSFAIEGARGRVAAASDAVRIELGRNDADMRVMAAARWFRDHGHFDPHRAKWLWPEGFDPGQLMVELECRLDQWARDVKTQFIESTGGVRLARQAVGLRAVALAAAGGSHAVLATSSSVVNAVGEQRPRPSEAWLSADQAAAEILSTLRVAEYVGEFAAVRQGESGQPQLVDPRELDAAIASFLAVPEAALSEVVSAKADPVLAQGAQKLLSAMSAVSADTAASARAAKAFVESLLEGHTPAEVARAAEEVGVVARDAGFFRPAEASSWADFRSAVDALAAAPDLESLGTVGDDLGDVLKNQRAIRELESVGQALGFVKRAMDETKRESERGGGHAGDVATLRAEVTKQLGEVADLAKSFGREGK